MGGERRVRAREGEGEGKVSGGRKKVEEWEGRGKVRNGRVGKSEQYRERTNNQRKREKEEGKCRYGKNCEPNGSFTHLTDRGKTTTEIASSFPRI